MIQESPSRVSCAVVATLLAAGLPALSMAQRSPVGFEQRRATALNWFAEMADDRWRLRRLVSADSPYVMLRGASSALSPFENPNRGPYWSFIEPQLFASYNSALPATHNFNGLWSGRGASARLLGGVRLEVRRLRLIVAPQLLHAKNQTWELVRAPFWAPPIVDFSPFANPWNISTWSRSPYSIDQPLRFGDASRTVLDAGESGIWYVGRRLEAGVTNEHEWWGPGIRNALILSNNARGFTHSIVRTREPWRTRLGAFEGRWLVGSLRESPFFDGDVTNDRNTISALSLAWHPPSAPDLGVGIARAVYAPFAVSSNPLLRPLDVFRGFGQPNARLQADTEYRPSRDQLTSVFFRWGAPADSFAVHAEVGRAEWPVNLRDLLLESNHSLGFTVGAEQARTVGKGVVRVQLEVTQLEQGSTKFHRPSPSWYTSRAVRQGYTNDGLVLGAASGPGSSSQWVAVDFYGRQWSFGAFISRVRANTDALFTIPLPDAKGYCEFDVTWAPGARVSGHVVGIGTLSASVVHQYRYNLLFQNSSGCPLSNSVRDVRNLALTFAVVPGARGPDGLRSRPYSAPAAEPPTLRLAAGRHAHGLRSAGAEAFVGGEVDRYLRVLQNSGDVAVYPWSLRAFLPWEIDRLAPSSPAHPWDARFSFAPARPGLHVAVARPTIRLRYNSAFPFGGNEWGVWSGRGLTTSVRAGVAVRWGPLSLSLIPTAFRAENSSFDLAAISDTTASPFSDPAYPRTIDLPQRFGATAYQRVDWGQSTAALDGRRVTAGVSTANLWWGPMSSFPIMFSNNAPGFPHIFFGTSKPLDLRLLRVHTRMVFGTLDQSAYFSPVGVTRARRFGAGAILVAQPGFLPNLEFGASRFFHAPYPDRGLKVRHFTRIFEGIRKSRLPVLPDSNPIIDDSRSVDGENQLGTVFLRWAAPGAGLEVYGELGREDHPWDLREMIVTPDRQGALGIGARKTWSAGAGRRTVLRFEQLSYLPNAISRPGQAFTTADFYTHSSGANQGHTQRGQLLGANLGAGSSSGAEVGWDRYTPAGRTTLTWQRVVRRDQRAPLSGGERNLAAYDVQHAIGAERLLFRSRADLLAGATMVFEFHRNYVRDVRNVSLYVAVTGLAGMR